MTLTQAQIHEMMEEIRDDGPRNRARKTLQDAVGALVDANQRGLDVFELRALEFFWTDAISAAARGGDRERGDEGPADVPGGGDDLVHPDGRHRDPEVEAIARAARAVGGEA